jgi:hypothetical protein
MDEAARHCAAMMNTMHGGHGAGGGEWSGMMGMGGMLGLGVMWLLVMAAVVAALGRGGYTAMATGTARRSPGGVIAARGA